MFSLPAGTWLLQSSHLGRWLGFSSKILIISPQCYRIKCKCKTFHMRENPGQPGKEQGQGHCLVYCVNLTYYTWVWWSVWLTNSRLQSIAGSVLCMRCRCDAIDPWVAQLQILGMECFFGVSPCTSLWPPVHFRYLSFSEFPNRVSP